MRPEVTYWIARRSWGPGVATRALGLLLEQAPDRPVLAGTVADNLPSLAVLRRLGFQEIGRERIMALGRGVDVEGVRLRPE